MTATIIIPVFNCWEYTKKCLDSILPTKHDIIVIDNGSTDETPDRLKRYKKHNGVRVLTNDTNLGFAKAVNRGIKLCSTDVILLNNDTEVPEGWINVLQSKYYSLDQCGVLGVRQINSNGQIIHAGAYKLPLSKFGFSNAPGEDDMNQFADDYECELVNFACVYISREVIDKVGLLDENIFAYAEDDDYCIRVHNAGYKVYNTSVISILHHHNITAQQIDVNKTHTESLVYLEKKYPTVAKTTTVGFHSTVGANQFMGYSKSCAAMIRAILELKPDFDLNYSFLYGSRIYEPMCRDMMVADIQRNAPDASNCDVQILYGHGDMVNKNSGKYRIGFTMLEVDGYPKSWVEQLNKLDEVWTPTEYSKLAMQNSGVTKPITVIPLGVDPYRYNPNIKPLTLPLGEDHIKILALLDGDTRRNTDILISAYCEAFTQSDKVLLVIKASNQHIARNILEQLGKIKTNPNHAPMTVLLDNHDNMLMLPDYLISSLYRSCDAFVSATSGEGWGMMGCEALSCGLPVIITSYKGASEALRDTNNNLLPGVIGVNYTIVPAVSQHCAYYKGFKWAKPDKQDLINKFQYLVQNIQSEKEKALQGSEYMLKYKTWTHTAQKIIGVINGKNKQYEIISQSCRTTSVSRRL